MYTWVFIAAFPTFFNSPELEPIQMVLQWVQSHHKILLSNHGERAIGPDKNLDEPQGNYAKCKKPVSKEYIL